MLETLRKLFWISRPISWPNTSYPFAVGFLLSLGILPTGEQLATFIIGTLYFIGPYNLLVYGINDVYDYESDIKNPRKGGIEGMKESRAFHPTILRAVAISNVPFLAYLLWAGSAFSNIILLLVIFGALAYSLKGLRFKEVPFLDSITSSFHFVGPALYGVALVGITGDVWPWLIAFFLWGMASHAFGAVQDIIPDRQGGLHSIATQLGASYTVWFSLLLYIAATVIIAAQGVNYLGIAIAGLLYCANIIRYIGITDDDSGATNTAWKRFLWLNYISGAIVTVTILILFTAVL